VVPPVTEVETSGNARVVSTAVPNVAVPVSEAAANVVLPFWTKLELSVISTT